MNILKRAAALVLFLAMLLCLTACAKTTEPAASPDATGPTGSFQPGMRYIASQLSKPDSMGEAAAMALDGETLYVLDSASSLFAMDMSSGGWTALDIDLGEGYPLSMTAGSGKLYLLLSRENSPLDDDTFILVCDPADKTVQRIDKPPLSDGASPKSIFFIQDRLLLLSSFDGISSYSLEGEYIASADSASSIIIADGKPYVTASGSGGTELCALNIETLELTPMFSVGEEYSNFFSYLSESEFLCVTDRSVSMLDAGTGFAQPMFNWLDVGFVFYYFPPIGLTVTSAGELIFADPSSGEIYHLSRSDAPETRKELTIAVGAGVSGTYLSQAMAIFNMTNPDYIAKEKVYSREDASKIPAELATGNDIDVVYMGTNTDMESAFRSIPLKSSLFEDLLPYLDTDPELSREDFIPGVLDSMLQNGRLYGIVPSVIPYTVIAPKDFADSLESWDIDALIKLNDGLPEGCGLFDSYSPEYTVQGLMQYACARFIDMDSVSCSFDSEEFIKLLKLCAVAKPYDYSSSNGCGLNMGTAAVSPTHYRNTFNGEFEFIGFPSEKGGLSLLSQSIGPFSIMASSESKEAAWQFIRLLFLPQIQNNEVCSFGMPVIESCFDKALEQRISRDESITQADAERYKALVMDCHGFIQGGAVYDIVIEEVNKFLGGGKTAEDTAKSTQSRAGIYLSEQFG